MDDTTFHEAGNVLFLVFGWGLLAVMALSASIMLFGLLKTIRRDDD